MATPYKTLDLGGSTFYSKVERNSNYNFKLEFQFCAICPKLFILKKFYFSILESNLGPHHKYSSKWVIKYKNQRVLKKIEKNNKKCFTIINK